MNKEREALEKIQELTHYCAMRKNLLNGYYEIQRVATEALEESELKEYGLDEVSKIAQWVIDNRYPKNENNKVSDFEMYYKIIELIQSLQSEIEQPKSESRMYSQDVYLRFTEWATENAMLRLNNKWWYADLVNNITTEQLFAVYLQSLQPKTEEVERGWTITDAKEQPTSLLGGKYEAMNNAYKEINSTSIEKEADTVEKMAEERYPNEILLNQFRRSAFIEGYKANNHFDELEKWVEDFPFLLSPDNVIAKIQELKTK